MEARLGGNAHHFFGPIVSNVKALGKRSMEWDLNDWKWDGDLFTATPLQPMPVDCRSRQFFPVGIDVQRETPLSNSSSSCSDETNLRGEKGKRELEKRRRVVVVEDEELRDEAGSLNLNLGGQFYPVTEEDAGRWEGKSGKKSKVVGTSLNRAVCQVDDCRGDLSNAKEYHRRHKVCEIHSKATRAMVGGVMQRFCQQCSRFHALQEFDEGKRSCRRRLAGHNRRRRKTHPENPANGLTLNDERGSSYLLISLLRILSNIHSNSSVQIKDQDLLSHLLRNLASLAGTVNERNISGLLAGSQEQQNVGTSFATQAKEPPQPCRQKPDSQGPKRSSAVGAQIGILQTLPSSQSPSPFLRKDGTSAKSSALETTVGRIKLHNIDLNSVYDDSQEVLETPERFDTPASMGTTVVGCPMWLHPDSNKSSPPRTSGHSGSTATQSPSSSSEEAQCRTDRIVFKLFGKDPGEFPLVLRQQILDWLSHSPSDIESYIRPGCIILTIYLRLDNSLWEELCYDMNSSLRKLLDASNDSFWRTGWVYARVLNHFAFVCDGQLVLKAPLPLKRHRKSIIMSIKPIAVSFSERAEFSVKGFNFSRSTTRLLCAFEGSYLVQKFCSDVLESADSSIKHDDVQTLNFSCSVPNIAGRGFIEIEDDSLSSSFFPFIVADRDVCSEICTLEGAIELAEPAEDLEWESEKMVQRKQALDIINEMGWLLHRDRMKSRLAGLDPNINLFSFRRFKQLLEFSVDHSWCAVVKKLLVILFSGTVDSGEHPSIEIALQELALLHRAVRRNCRPMVEVLLNYSPEGVKDLLGLEAKEGMKAVHNLFRPDDDGPGGLTPLHVAASRDGSETVVDALTNDPQQVGVEAWRNARDRAGLTPNDYASLRGHYTYIRLVQKKINKRSGVGHVVLEIPQPSKQKLVELGHSKPTKFSSFQTEVDKRPVQGGSCSLCEQKLGYYGSGKTTLAIYRPAMLSMVAIAAVCVCVALLFKSSPKVNCIFEPFRWERLKFGAS